MVERRGRGRGTMRMMMTSSRKILGRMGGGVTYCLV